MTPEKAWKFTGNQIRPYESYGGLLFVLTPFPTVGDDSLERQGSVGGSSMVAAFAEMIGQMPPNTPKEDKHFYVFDSGRRTRKLVSKALGRKPSELLDLSDRDMLEYLTLAHERGDATIDHQVDRECVMFALRKIEKNRGVAVVESKLFPLLYADGMFDARLQNIAVVMIGMCVDDAIATYRRAKQELGGLAPGHEKIAEVSNRRRERFITDKEKKFQLAYPNICYGRNNLEATAHVIWDNSRERQNGDMVVLAGEIAADISKQYPEINQFWQNVIGTDNS